MSLERWACVGCIIQVWLGHGMKRRQLKYFTGTLPVGVDDSGADHGGDPTPDLQ